MSSSSSTTSFPHWYGHLYPAVNSHKANELWPPLSGEMGRLLNELKMKIEKEEVARADASRYLFEYKKEVKSLVYKPTKRDLDFQAHYESDRKHRMMPSSLSLRWLSYPLVAFAPADGDAAIAKEYAAYEEKSWLPTDFYEHHWAHCRDAEISAAEKEFYSSTACESFTPGYFIVRRENKDDAHPDAVQGFYYPTYGYFQSISQFKQWLDALPVDHKMFHEIVIPERPQKLFFDIDAEQEKIDAATKKKESLLTGKSGAEARVILFDTFISVLKAEFKRVYNVDLTDANIVICDSSNEKKFSCHVLITDYHELNFQERKFFAMTVYYALITKDTMVGSFLDSAPLKHPNASLRIAGCHKWGQVARTKKILSKHSFLDTLIQHIPSSSVVLPALAPPPTAYSGRPGGGFVEERISKFVAKAFPDMYETDECERRGNLFIYPGNWTTLCPFCNVHHGNVGSHGLMVALIGKKCKAFCPRWEAHPDDRCEEKVKVIGTLDYPMWCVDATEAVERSGRIQTLAPTDLPNVVHIKEKELNRDLCIEYLDKCDTLIVRSPMGTAKTKALINYCEKKNPGSVVILGCRVAYDKGLAVRYSKGTTKYTNYLDVKEKKISLETHRHLVVQIESLHRLLFRQDKDGKAVWPELLILDEIEGLIQQFTHDTMLTSGTIHRCWEVFEALVKYSKKVVMMDAFVGRRTVDLATRMRDAKTTISVVNGYPAAENRAYGVLPKLKQSGLMQAYLRKGRPFVFCSNSLKHIKKVKKIFETQIVEEKLPPKKIRDYTSETGQEMRKDLENPDVAWADVDVLIYSPTITIGCSFEVNHFKSIFAYFVETSCGFLDCIQMLGRVRDCKPDDTDNIHLYFLAFSDHYMVYDEEPSAAWIETCLEKTYLRARDNSKAKVLTAEEKKAMYSKMDADEREEKVYNDKQTTNKVETKEIIAVRLDGVERHIESDGKLALVKDNYYYAQISNSIEEIKSRNNFVYYFLLYLLDSGANVDLRGCACIPAVARDLLEDASEIMDTVERKKAYEELAEEISMESLRDDDIMREAKDGLKKADAEVKKDEAMRLGKAESLTPMELEEINASQRGQMSQTTLNAVAKATLAKAYGIESSQVDVEFAEQYADTKLRTIFKRLRESTAEESVAVSIEKLKQRSGAIVLTNMSATTSTTQLDCKDKSLRHELCEGMMKLMGFDLTKAKRWEKLPTPKYDTTLKGLKSGLPAYITQYRTALVRELGKKNASLLNPEQWEDKRVREFAQGVMLSTYGVKVQLAAGKDGTGSVSVALDESKAPFHWSEKEGRYETKHKPDSVKSLQQLVPKDEKSTT